MKIISKIAGGLTGLLMGTLACVLALPYTFYALSRKLRLEDGYSWPRTIANMIFPGTLAIFFGGGLIQLRALAFPFEGLLQGSSEGFFAGLGFLKKLHLTYKNYWLDQSRPFHSQAEPVYANSSNNNQDVPNIEDDPNITLARARSRNQRLLDHISSLPAPGPKETLLDEQEIKQYQEIIAATKNEAQQEVMQTNLDQYQNEASCTCPISHEAIKDPITVRINKTGKTYNYSQASLEEWIRTSPKMAEDPITRYVLASKKDITLTRGFSFSAAMKNFIAAVRETIKNWQARPAYNNQRLFAAPNATGSVVEITQNDTDTLAEDFTQQIKKQGC